MFDNWLQLTQNDASLFLKQLSLPSLDNAITWGAFLLIFFFPLKSINRDDAITGWSYSIFITATAIALLFALPITLRQGSSIDIKSSFLYTGLIFFLSWLRFNSSYLKKAQTEQIRTIVRKKEEENG